MNRFIKCLTTLIKFQPTTSNHLQTEKTFHELLQAFNHKICPVCNLLEKKEKKYLHHLLYELVNDVTTNKKLEESGGMCNHHINLFLEFNDKLGQAILAHSLLGNMIKNQFEFKKNTECMVCTYRHKSESFLIHDFARYLESNYFQDSLTFAWPLCLNHFNQIKTAITNENQKKFLINWQATKINELLKHLESFIRKNDYRFAQEKISSEEQQSILQAWQLLIRL